MSSQAGLVSSQSGRTGGGLPITSPSTLGVLCLPFHVPARGVPSLSFVPRAGMIPVFSATQVPSAGIIGAGILGSPLARLLADRGYPIIAVWRGRLHSSPDSIAGWDDGWLPSPSPREP